jgi:hypothetical protein
LSLNDPEDGMKSVDGIFVRIVAVCHTSLVSARPLNDRSGKTFIG